MKRNEFYRKLLAFSMSLIVVFTFIPVLGGAAFAEDAAVQPGDVTVEAADYPQDVVTDAEILTDNAAPAEKTAPAGEDTAASELQTEPSLLADNTGEPVAVSEAPAVVPGEMPSISQPQGEASLDADEAYHNVVVGMEGSTFTVNGKILDKYKNTYKFGRLYVDPYITTTSISGGTYWNINSTSVNKSIDMNQFATGFHTVVLEVKVNGTTNVGLSLAQRYVPSNTITDKPTYKGVFEVYSKKLNIYPYNMAGANSSMKLFLEYSSNGGKTWKRSGYMEKNLITLAIDQGFTIKGLKANKKYKTRLRYGEFVTYDTDYFGDGNSYFFGGPALGTGTKKTGKAQKPPIRSVKIKAIKVKFHKHRVPGHYEWVGNSLIWCKAYTEKYYTCKYKVIVKLKKKPGTKGIWVNGKFLKGNKKKYSVKFTPYPNYFVKKPPKGLKKVTVKIRTYQNKKYYGFSPTYKKKKRITR